AAVPAEHRGPGVRRLPGGDPPPPPSPPCACPGGGSAHCGRLGTRPAVRPHCPAPPPVALAAPGRGARDRACLPASPGSARSPPPLRRAATARARCCPAFHCRWPRDESRQPPAASAARPAPTPVSSARVTDAPAGEPPPPPGAPG